MRNFKYTFAKLLMIVVVLLLNFTPILRNNSDVDTGTTPDVIVGETENIDDSTESTKNIVNLENGYERETFYSDAIIAFTALVFAFLGTAQLPNLLEGEEAVAEIASKQLQLYLFVTVIIMSSVFLYKGTLDEKYNISQLNNPTSISVQAPGEAVIP